ncbi:hypothetical protein [Burkholderia sp. LMG 32019]|uniref:DUF7822 domain-containing protein n=1 Tax=Burkholderia sp. LMG 32019 TaxID=3158173 RepID=UPI003C2D32A4
MADERYTSREKTVTKVIFFEDRPGMSDRFYLYNVDEIGPSSGPCTGMMEWKYIFPTILRPLLSRSPLLARTRCNDSGEDDGIYAVASGGKAFLRKLYDFLERHSEQLVDDVPAFLQAKRRIFAFLDNRATGNYFHLDGAGVFYSCDEDAAKFARFYLDQIQRDNEIIRKAIEADLPNMLDLCEGLQFEEVATFRESINQSHYDYGWEPLTSAIYDSGELLSTVSLIGRCPVLKPIWLKSIRERGLSGIDGCSF